MSTKKSKTPIKYPLYEMEDKGKLILPMDVVNQIMYLHASIGKTEWSGILLYDVIRGNPSKPKEFVLKAKHIFLMDIGSAAFTEYETDSDIVDLYDNVEGAMSMKIGHVHSHHDMSAYFSGTDTQELMDNSDKHNYYLSLIVNFSGNYVAKVAFISERKTTSYLQYNDDTGTVKKFQEVKTEKTLVTIDMQIVLEYNNSFFYDRIKQIYKKKEDEKKMKAQADKMKSFNKTSYKQLKSPNYGQHNIFDTETDDWRRYEREDKEEEKTTPPDPEKLTDLELEILTRNLLAANPELSEGRSVYQVLYAIANSQASDLEFYYEYFDDNLESVLDEFFNVDIGEFTNAQMSCVIKEVIMSIRRFEGHFPIKNIIPDIVKKLVSFMDMFETMVSVEKDLDAEMDKLIKT